MTREREVKYRVYWTKTAVRDLRRLDRRLAERIIDSVEEASLNPFVTLRSSGDCPSTV